MNISEKITALRRLMEQQGWDAAVIPGTDPHGSEYLPERWQQRKWISGFTGSFGTVVVTHTHAGLWTDTRYFIQARKELEGTEFELHPLRVPDAVDYPQWLAASLPAGSVTCIDGECMTYRQVMALHQSVRANAGSVVDRPSYLDDIGRDKPPLPLSPVFVLEPKYCGRETEEKIQWLRRELFNGDCSHILLSGLDQIAWLFNIRSHDIPYNPVAIAYALVDSHNATLFIREAKVGDSVKKTLRAQGVDIAPYESLKATLESISPDSVFMADGDTLNHSLFQFLLSRFGTAGVKDVPSPVILAKAVKNPVETEGFRKAFLHDGLAMERFLFWLEKSLEQDIPLSEKDAADKLSWMRTLSPDAMGDSFQYIPAYGANAAMPHYSAAAASCTRLEKKGLFLIDSGGHYLYGTTDITRTVPLGPLTPLEREDYTVALKGMIALSRAVFLKGTRGTHLDMLAKDPLWRYRRNYGHGTGHGIGHFLCVHEGPQDIRMTWKDQELLPGMVTSNEPGIYREGSHGVRHENILLCKELEENEFGHWLGFETLTLCHIDTSAIVVSLMERGEIEWLNRYNKSVYEKMVPFLTYEESRWLKEKTAPLT
ncbi:MAG: aminopeptidase P family N-terminal domain-containing protein [Bacteroidales bacterium]|jgi:Xaa-Pro aminopeptidase|nr:aminopeptidase P family N-terminal domain-containing protein [Bacteroidales bacterium]NLH22979.1 M24 family metallopeptidase [Bacteroidales bacterium]